jgi:DNA-binding CsgD family transcriptional regulator/tetratricopeptide (TPR) repeat protein
VDRDDPAGTATAAPTATWPFAGRAEDLAAIGRALRPATGTGILIRGAAGIGKSALAAEAVQHLQAGGRRVFEVRGRSNDPTVAFSGLSQHLADLRVPPQSDAAVLATAAHRLANDGWDAIVVDDVDRLDGPSAQVIHHVASTGQIPVLLTARTGAALPDPVVGLRVDGSIEQRTLGPLSDEAVATVLDRALGSQVDAATVRRFALLSEGHPLHLRELVRSASERGVLTVRGGVLQWSADASGSWELGGLIRERLSALDPAARRAASLVALAAPVPRAVVVGLVGSSPLDEAIRREVVVVVADRSEGVVMADPLLAQVLVDGLDPEETARLHLDLAEAFEPHRSSGDLIRSVGHRIAAGAEVPQDLALAAALEADHLGDPVAALRIHRSLLSHRPIEAGVGVGEALQVLGDDDGARTAFTQAAASGATGDLRARIEVGLHRADRHAGLVDPERSRQLVTSGPAASPATERERRYEAAAGLLASGHPQEALDLTLPAGARRAAPADPRAAAIAAVALSLEGRTEQAIELLDQTTGIASKEEAAPGWWEAAQLAGVRVEVLVRRGDASALRRLANELRGRTTREGHLHPDADQVHLAEGLADLLAGDGPSAARSLRQAAQVAHRSVGGRSTEILARCRLVSALVLAGETVAARHAFDELDDLRCDPAGGTATWGHLDGEHRLAEAWLDPADTPPVTAVDRSAELALHHLRWRRTVGTPNGEAAARVIAAAARIDGPWALAVGTQVEGFRDQDGRALDRAADEFALLGRWLEASEAAADAAGTHAAAGCTREAAVSAAAADRYRTRAGRRSTVRVPPVLDLPALTRREREVAMLAASGLSNRAIADQLVLSVRTIEGHLLRASAKVGADSRRALGDIVTAWPDPAAH